MSLREHLIRTMIAGDVATPRQNNLRHMRRLASGDPYYAFGLDFDRSWTFEEIFRVMVERCGIDPDREHFYGDDTIDPDLTIGTVEAAADLIGEVAARRGTVVLASGHPTGILVIHTAVARALRAVGCRVVTPAAGWSYQADTGRRTIAYVDGVAVLEGAGALHHTHDAAPMVAMLEELAADSGNWPDLAIADHGWAGAAGQAGITTVGFADCNDPALFVGAEEGRIAVAVPLDDNVPPQHYAPLTGHLLHRAGLTDPGPGE